jgi:predicted SAM-dependent methyltransferase
MKEIIKKQIKYFINRFGYDITKKSISSLSLYYNFPAESLKARRFYNIGAGLFYHPYWTNIDYATDYYSVSQKKPFINYNLMELKPLPLESNVAEIVYSSHTIEHISDDAVINMLKESYRILKPGGCIRLTTPDALLEFKAYKRNDITFWYWIDDYSRRGTWEKLYKIPLSKASIHQLFLHHFASQICEIDIDDSPKKKYADLEIVDIFKKYSMEEALNYFTKQCKFNPNHPGNHINWWTHEKLLSLLQEVGFSECYKSGYGQSLFSPVRDTSLFDSTHPKISLYVEAIK